MTTNRAARYRDRHRAELNAKARERYRARKEYENARARAWREANPELNRAIQRASDARPERRAAKAAAERTPERKAIRKAWKLANAEKAAAIFQRWERAHRAERRVRHHERQASDPQYVLRRTLRARLKIAIKKNYKRGSAIELLGCSIAELKRHLEALWLPGMSWENFGRLHAANGPIHWQIDHKRPLSSFDLTDMGQLKIACHYTNLQPLWALDNRRKWNKTESGKEVANVL